VSGAAENALAAFVERAAADPEALVAVVGPTASGKTALAIELGRALGGEVVGCDSVQIYRRFDIGAGKPSAEELAALPHHLVGCADPLEAIDAARYVALAEDAMAAIRQRGRRPILCGGTYLWTKALTFGLAEAPGRDDDARARHQALVEREGRAALHAELAKVDPASAARLHPNDVLRVSRALEVFEASGKPMSAWHADHGFRAARHRPLLVGVGWSAEALSERIERRVTGMMAQGWVDEVRTLVADGYGEARAMGSVGYREVRAFLDGALPESELVPTIVRSTRVFARRQRTWLREEPVTWITG
jgi:tRNA dimethylallyltransferase